MVARRAHNPKVMRFESHLRYHRGKIERFFLFFFVLGCGVVVYGNLYSRNIFARIEGVNSAFGIIKIEFLLILLEDGIGYCADRSLLR